MQTTAGNTKRHTPRRTAGPQAREQEHINKAPSNQQRQETPNAHCSGGNKATHTAPNSPECNRIQKHATTPCHQGKKQQEHSAHSHTRGAGQTPRRLKCYLAPGRRCQSVIECLLGFPAVVRAATPIPTIASLGIIVACANGVFLVFLFVVMCVTYVFQRRVR